MKNPSTSPLHSPSSSDDDEDNGDEELKGDEGQRKMLNQDQDTPIAITPTSVPELNGRGNLVCRSHTIIV